MKLLPLLANILIFILNCGGKKDLTPGDLYRSSTSKGRNTQQKVVNIVYYHIYKLFLYSGNMSIAQGDYY